MGTGPDFSNREKELGRRTQNHRPDSQRMIFRRAVSTDAPSVEGLYRELVADPAVCKAPRITVAAPATGADGAISGKPMVRYA